MNQSPPQQLDALIAEWCQTVLAKGGISADDMAELQDHLYCEIERNLAAGLTESEAFVLAIPKLGEPATLGAEFAKNHSWLAKLVGTTNREALIEGRSETMSQKKYMQITIANLLLFAVTILATAWILADTAYFRTISLLMYTLWFGMHMSFLRAAGRTEKTEWNCVKRKILTLLGRG